MNAKNKLDSHSNSELYSYIQAKIRSLHCPMYAIGGVTDHLHRVVSIPPSQSIADFVKRIKGSSSHHLNRTFPQQTFAWQREYGVFSLGGKQLDWAIVYGNHQNQHHTQKCSIALSKSLLNLRWLDDFL